MIRRRYVTNNDTFKIMIRNDTFCHPSAAGAQQYHQNIIIGNRFQIMIRFDVPLQRNSKSIIRVSLK